MGRDFQGLPQYIETIGDVYPVSWNDYDKFRRLAYKYMMYSYEFLKNKLKITDENVKVFDYLMLLVLSEEDSKKKLEMLNELEVLFSLVLRTPVTGYLGNKDSGFVFMVNGNEEFTINRNNYDELRTVVFRQNLLFDQIFAPNEFSQKTIDNAIEVLNKGGQPIDTEAMESYFITFMKIHPSELSNYSYYQVRALCEVEMRKQMDFIVHLYRSQGGKADTVNILEQLNIHRNPYGKDVLFKKVNKSDDDKMNKMLGN